MQNDLLDWCLKEYGQEIMQPGLSRIKSALRNVLPNFSKTKIIIVAGTNGKGETTLRLSELLRSESHCVWTSPHIVRITERFRDEKGEIPEDELKQICFDCHNELKSTNIKLSFYEFLFFVFCTWASKKNPEFLLLEVGLGGKMDAVNVFDADLVLLPSISRDHQEFLGNRYDQILFEKLGTLRPKTTLIHFLESKYLIEKTQKYCDGIGATSICLKHQFSVPEYKFSTRNYLLATAAYKLLFSQSLEGINVKEIPNSLENRGETLLGENEWIFYGSHNVDGMRKLIQFLHSSTYNFSRPPFDLIFVAFSKRPVDDLKVMLKMLKASSLGKVVVTTFPHPKAQLREVVEALSREEGLEFASDIETYVLKNKHQKILVTGSYYFMGHVKSLSCCR